MGDRYKVFISSTYLDNERRRKVVEDAILRADMEPIGMERFTASVHPTLKQCLSYVRSADVTIFILAYRYGWIPEGCEYSITELEYDAARQRLIFELDEPLTEEQVDEGADRWSKQDKLEVFKARAGNEQMPAKFKDDTLGQMVLQALQKWKKELHSPRPQKQDDRRPELRFDSLVTRLQEKLRGLNAIGASHLPFALVGGTYLDVLLDPVTTKELGPHEWSNLSPPEIRVGGSTACVGRFLHRFYEKKSHLFTAAGRASDQADVFTREYHRLLKIDRTWIESGHFVSGEENSCAVTVLLYQSDDEFQTMLTYPGALPSLTWRKIRGPLRNVFQKCGGVLYLSGFLKTGLYDDLEEQLDEYHKHCLICLDHGRLRPENPRRQAIDRLTRAFRRGLIDFYICTLEDIRNFCNILSGSAGADDSCDPSDTVLEKIAANFPLPPVTFVRGEDVYRGEPVLFIITGGKVNSVLRPSGWIPGGTIGPKNAFNAAVLYSSVTEALIEPFGDYCEKVTRRAMLKCQDRELHNPQLR